MTLIEMMQARAEQVKAQRTLLDSVKNAGRDFTPEEEEQFSGIENKIRTLDKQIEREKVLAAREAQMQAPADQTFRPAAVAGAPVQSAKKENYGFSSLGEFMNAVRFGDSKGRLDAIRNEMSMGTDTAGGYMVPDEFRTDLLRVNPQESIVRSRATVIGPGTAPDAKLHIPALDQGSTANIHGGVEVNWIAEGGAKPATDAKLKEVTLEPKEVAATIVVTDKLLRNWSAAQSILESLLRQAMISAEDLAFLKGTGTTQPTGVLGAKSAIPVKRAVAAKIGWADVLAMLANLLPGANAVFIAHQTTLPQLMSIKDEAGNSIFIQGNATAGIPSTLCGYPIIFTGKTAALGAKGDLMLVDLSYYLIKDGAGPFVAASEHVHFVNNKTVIKCFWNVDGNAWLEEPLKLEDGVTTVSPFVVLDVVGA